METRWVSHEPGGVTTFDELGIYRILAAGDNHQEIERFVREWLGGLLDHDTARGSAPVQTLSRYFECGANHGITSPPTRGLP